MSGILFFSTTQISYAKEYQKSTGGSFITASIAEPSNLIPILATDSASQDIVDKVFSSLLRYNPNLELEGELATHWEIGNEGKEITFYLKPNVRWHDGELFTSEDVKFTYDRLTDPNLPSPYGGDFKKIEKLEIIDELTVKVFYKEPFSPALSSWAMWIMPKHILEKENLIKTPFARNPIGCGPYKFRRWVTGDKVEVVAFEDYHEGRPYIDRMVYRIIPDQATMFLELQQENLDSIGLTPLQYKRQTSSSFFKDKYTKYKYASFSYTYLGFNLNNKLFKDRRVRKAINIAIDKQEIIDGVLLGLGRVVTGPFSPDSWAYNSNVKDDGFSPGKAKALLNKSGWMDRDNNGILENKEGKEFRFTITTNQGNFQRQQTAILIQKRLEKVGIQVDIKVLEWSAFLKNVVQSHAFEAVLLGWGLSRDPDLYDLWHSSKTAPGEFNFIGYKNDKVDLLIEDARRVFDQEERKRIYHKLHKLIFEDYAYIFLFVGDALPIIHKRFDDVQVTSLGLGYYFNEWSISPDRRKYKRFTI